MKIESLTDLILKKKNLARIPLLGLAAFAAITAILLMLFGLNGDTSSDEDSNMPRDYVYESSVASNQMELHVLRTRPSNVTLVSIHNNVTISPYYGVNGGFFYQEVLLSIASVNDKPANSDGGSYGTGLQNEKYARGTLVWDGGADKMDVQIASQTKELKVSNRSNYWAQGGISMSLDQDDLWLERIAAENAPYPDEDRLRSAAVYDEDGYLYLIVSATKGTLADFRTAILENVGGGRLVNGIFLDGDGSSQLRSREQELSGDGRPVVQMLALIH